MPQTAPLDEACLTRLLARALSRGGDYADVFVEEERNQSLSWEEGRVKQAALSLSRGVGIRVLSGARTGYAYSEDFDERALLAVADTAAHIAAGGQSRSIHLEAGGHPEHYPIRLPLEETALAEKVELLRRMQAALLAHDGEVEKVYAGYNEGLREILIANSEGALVQDRQPLMRVNCAVLARRGERREMGRHSIGGRVGREFLDEHPVEEVAQEALRLARIQLDAVAAPAGAMPVVLGAAASGILLHEAVGHGLEADFNRKGTSKFSGRLGEKVTSELCSVVDDATRAHDRGAINIDDEGTQGRRNILIDKGVLVAYLQDRLSAGLMGLPLTGNGRRESYRHPPLPRMTCTYLLAGESSVEEILASTRRGFYAKSYSGGQVDISRGDFVFNVTEGYLIEDGRVGAPVKGATLVGNGAEVMSKVSMVAGDLAFSPGMWTCGKNGQHVPVNHGMPHVKISEMTIGGTRLEGESP